MADNTDVFGRQRIEVRINRQVQKLLLAHKIPDYIRDHFYFWKLSVETFGMQSTRNIPGWRNHALHGKRKGQRSIYLNASWRAIYLEETSEVIEVIDITKHKY